MPGKWANDWDVKSRILESELKRIGIWVAQIGIAVTP
jgi:hypothetical protein